MPEGKFYDRLTGDNTVINLWDTENNQYGCTISNATGQFFSQLHTNAFTKSSKKSPFTVNSVEEENGISEVKSKTAYQFNADVQNRNKGALLSFYVGTPPTLDARCIKA